MFVPVSTPVALSVVLSIETIAAPEWSKIRPALLALGSNPAIELRLTLWTAGSVRHAGPFRNRAALSAALDEIGPMLPAEQPADFDSTRLYQAIGLAASAVSPIPDRRPWGYLLWIGRFPTPPAELQPFISAWLLRRLGTERWRTGFWNLGPDDLTWLSSLVDLTGGLSYPGDSKLFLTSLLRKQGATEMEVEDRPLPRGFQLRLSELTTPEGVSRPAPEWLIAPGFDLPDPERFAEFLAAKDRILKGAAANELPDLVRTALAIQPGDRELLQRAAEQFRDGKRFGEAAPLWAALTKIDPSEALYFDEWGDSLYRLNQRADAEAPLREARQRNRRTARNSEQLARILLSRQQDREALELMAESLTLEPSNQPLWLERADASGRVGDRVQVAASLESAFALGGLFADRRIALARYYVDSQSREKALGHLDRLLAELPAAAGQRATIAALLEETQQAERALEVWRAVTAADASREDGYFHTAKLLLARGSIAESIVAADAGLKVVPKSAPLRLKKFEGLAASGDYYQARRYLSESAADTSDLAVLSRAATVADAESSVAAAAYQRWAQAIPAGDSGREEVLRRGLIVAIRDGDTERQTWFLQSLGQDPVAQQLSPVVEPPASSAFELLGGPDSLAVIADSPISRDPSTFLADFARALVDHAGTTDDKTRSTYLDSIVDHFQRLADLLPLGQRQGNEVRFVISPQDKPRSSKILDRLGLKLRTSKGVLRAEAAEKGARARRHDTTAALAIDEVGLQEALESGKPFEFTVPITTVQVYPAEPEWRKALFQRKAYPGGLAEALVREPQAAKVFSAVNSMDRKAAELLLSIYPLKVLSDRHADLLFYYAPALSIENQQWVLPGGIEAGPAWAKITGVDPSRVPQFLRALIEQDDGRILAFYATLADLDFEHQRFFTRTPDRALKFLELFRNEKGLRTAGALRGESDFLDFLRDVPLDAAGQVAFPGSPEVWMVARGAGYSASIEKKLKRAAAPAVEDEILIRLVKTKYKDAGLRKTELDNFLAVTQLDFYRQRAGQAPLDESAALLLAQRYPDSAALFPYFTQFPALDTAGFQAIFALSDRFKDDPDVEQSRLIGLVHSVTQLLSLLQDAGRVDHKAAAGTLVKFAQALQKAESPGQAASAALDAITGNLPEDNPDQSLRDWLLGQAHDTRLGDYGRVLALQKVPPLALMRTIDRICRRLSTSASRTEEIARLEAAIQAIPSPDVPKKTELAGAARENAAPFPSAKALQIVAQMKRKAAAKRVEARDFDRLGAELLDLTASQVLLALGGPIYGVYLRSTDLLVADDPLLLRKHQFVDLGQSPSKKKWLESELIVSSDRGGSFFRGGFSHFPLAAGQAAAVDVTRNGLTDAVISSQLAVIRHLPWPRLTERHLAAFAANVRLAREWIVQAALSADRQREIERATLGAINPTRRSGLLRAIRTRQWDLAWESITLSDLFFLGNRLAEGRDNLPWPSPLTAAFGRLRAPSANMLDLFAPVDPRSCSCQRAAFLPRPPYEDTQLILKLEPFGQRVAEFMLYLAMAADSSALPARDLAPIAEPLARMVFGRIQMADPRDWKGPIRAFAALRPRDLQMAMREPDGEEQKR